MYHRIMLWFLYQVKRTNIDGVIRVLEIFLIVIFDGVEWIQGKVLERKFSQSGQSNPLTSCERYLIHHKPVHLLTSPTHTIYDRVIQSIISTQCLISFLRLNGNVATARGYSILEASVTPTNERSTKKLSLLTIRVISEPEVNVL